MPKSSTPFTIRKTSKSKRRFYEGHNDNDTAQEVFEDDMVHSLGIDVDTEGKGLLIGKLRKLNSTIDIMDGGAYHIDKGYSQVWIKTTMTEDELDDWCYNTTFPRYFDIIGVFEKEWN